MRWKEIVLPLKVLQTNFQLIVNIVLWTCLIILRSTGQANTTCGVSTKLSSIQNFVLLLQTKYIQHNISLWIFLEIWRNDHLKGGISIKSYSPWLRQPPQWEWNFPLKRWKFHLISLFPRSTFRAVVFDLHFWFAISLPSNIVQSKSHLEDP